jgi:NTE family protein
VTDVESTHHFKQWMDRPAGDGSTQRTVFVLSGGGINGAAQAGMISELLARGITPDAVVGVSAGAINAVYLAGTPLDQVADGIVEQWREVGRHGIFHARNPERLWAVIRHREAIDSGARIAAIIDRVCPVDDLSDCLIPIRVGTLNLDQLRMEWHGSGAARPRVLASAAVPGVFPPVMIDGERHVDGGVGSPVPLAAAIEFEPTRLVVLDVSLMESHPRDETMAHVDAPHQSALEVFLASYDAARYRLTEAERAIIASDVEVIEISAGLPGSLHPESSKHVPQLIDLGSEAVRRVFDER